MTEAERIRALERAGTITADEAARLLAVLDDVDATDAELDAVERDAKRVEAGAAGTDDTRPSADGEARAEAHVDADDDASAHAAAPHVARWLEVHMLGGELDVRTRTDIDDVVVERGGDAVSLERHGATTVLRQFERDGSWLEQLTSGKAKTDIAVAVPPGTGVDLDVKAGEVRVGEVAFLKADMLAGELTVKRTEGIDVRMRAGELTATLRPTEGEHRVTMTAGEAKLRFAEGSDVTVDARVSMGELALGSELGSSGSGLSTSRTVTFGSGAATLKASASAGRLSIRHAKPRAADSAQEVEHA